MMTAKFTVIEGVLIAIAIYLLLQVVGGVMTVLDTSEDGLLRWFSAIFAVILGGIGLLLLRYVLRRRKKRISEYEAKIKAEQATPIGVSLVGIQEQGRPSGITVIAFLELIGGVVSVPLGAYVIIVPDNMIFPVGADIARIYGMSFVLFGIIGVISGYGLLRRKGWGWHLTVIALFASFAWGIMYTVLTPTGEMNVEYASLSVSIGVLAVELYYLYRPHVRAHFGLLHTNTEGSR